MKLQKPDPRYQELAEKWLNGSISPDEEVEFAKWYNSGQQVPLELPTDFDASELEQRMMYGLARKTAAPVRRLLTWGRAAAAAVLLVCSAAGLYYFIKPKAATYANDLKPGGSAAYLTLANGQKIVLTGRANGLVANQGAAHIQKTADGNLVYNGQGNEALFNTIETPRGGEYQLVLSDGTRVWLNAASSLHYPAGFTGKERRVTLTGEAYFEVAKDPAHPFIVASAGQEVRVLGTHFNINTYEKPVATLLEGAVKVTAGDASVALKPGQQSILDQGLLVRETNTEQAVAWKSGYFRFNGEPIREVLLQLSRWYDMDVVYEGSISNEGFIGTISRYKNISQALGILERTRSVHFRVEGRKVIVHP